MNCTIEKALNGWIVYEPEGNSVWSTLDEAVVRLKELLSN